MENKNENLKDNNKNITNEDQNKINTDKLKGASDLFIDDKGKINFID